MSATATACPICGRPAQAGLKPFCSPRCADVDLGRWLGERYVIPGEDEAGTDSSEPDDERPFKNASREA